jgi:tRNA-dihydrouridine synthase B
MPSAQIHIGGLRVAPPLILAPMSGLSHTVLRRLVAELGGCGLFHTEMLSARSLPFETPLDSPWLCSSKGEHPIVYQLLVSRPEELPAAVEKVQACGADGIDLNMGCTAAVIVKRGGGIALMRDRARAAATVKAARRSTNLPLTVKIRLGWTPDSNALKEFCLMLEGNGVDAITLHPRLKEDRLKRPARWRYIAGIKEHLEIPVIGNGDVDSPEAALRMFRQTGCDAVMVGRAAVRRPWLFREIKASLLGPASDRPAPEPPEIYTRFVSLLEDGLASERRLPLLKQFTVYFAQNYAFGHTLWRLVHNARSLAEATDQAEAFFRSQGTGPA